MFESVLKLFYRNYNFTLLKILSLVFSCKHVVSISNFGQVQVWNVTGSPMDNLICFLKPFKHILILLFFIHNITTVIFLGKKFTILWAQHRLVIIFLKSYGVVSNDTSKKKMTISWTTIPIEVYLFYKIRVP